MNTSICWSYISAASDDWLLRGVWYSADDERWSADDDRPSESYSSPLASRW